MDVVPGRISIVIATHNGAATIERAFLSAITQQGDIEVVVVDDASDDTTPELLARLVQRYPALRTLRTPKQFGRPAGPRNHGAADLASGEFIIFLDDDDEILPGSVELHRKAIRDVAVSYGDAVIIDQGSLLRASDVWGTEMELPYLFQRNARPLNALMVRRSWFEYVGGFNESLVAFEDWHLWLQIALSGGLFAKLDQVVCQYSPRPAEESHWRSPAQRMAGPISKVAMFADLKDRFPEHRKRLLRCARSARLELAGLREGARTIEGTPPSASWRIREALSVLVEAGISYATLVYVARSFARLLRSWGQRRRSSAMPANLIRSRTEQHPRTPFPQPPHHDGP